MSSVISRFPLCSTIYVARFVSRDEPSSTPRQEDRDSIQPAQDLGAISGYIGPILGLDPVLAGKCFQGHTGDCEMFGHPADLDPVLILLLVQKRFVSKRFTETKM